MFNCLYVYRTIYNSIMQYHKKKLVLHGIADGIAQ